MRSSRGGTDSSRRIAGRGGRTGIPMAIAVVDAEGGAQLFTRMDGTLPVSSELAVSKAYTAAILRMSSAEVGKQLSRERRFTESKSTHNGESFSSVEDFLFT